MITTALMPYLCKIVTQIINPGILLISAAAFVYFIFGVGKFIIDTSQGKEADEGRAHMFWGIVGLAVIFGAYGIINLALGTFNLGHYSGPGCSTGAPAAYGTTPYGP